jgi:RHH-type proline utilization regulon transcriptional repressor/proline dehydrogenase/delta 1-pyrroline-5-carboxylate dehydrogenase
VPLSVSAPPEGEASLAARLDGTGAERLRILGPIGDDLARQCHQLGIAIDDTPVTGHGRVELPCWLREQSISCTLHRHGRIGTPLLDVSRLRGAGR